MTEGFKILGRRLEKTEAVQKATGELKYCGDLSFPNTLHVKILRSPHAQAYVRHVDLSRTKRLKGVRAAIAHADVPQILTMHQFLHVPAYMHFDSYLLEEKVRHHGDRVAAVAAVSPDLAEEALELIDVEYEPLPAVLDLEEAGRPGAPVVHDQARRGDRVIAIENNIVDQRDIAIGDVETGFRQADLVVENVFRTSRPNNAPLERTVVTCVPGPGGRLDVFGTTQGIHAMRMNIASSLGLPLSKINCHRLFLGGSFGAHIHTGWIEPICAFLALQTGRPVRGEKTREEMFFACGRHPMRLKVKTGVRKDGLLTAQEIDIVDDTGAYAVSGGSKMALAAGFCLSMYKCPNMKITGRTVYTNTPPLTAMRGAGNPQVHFAIESQMDIIAEELGLDPIELRLKNHITVGDTFYGQGPDVVCEVKSCGTEALLRLGAERINWAARGRHETDRPWLRRGLGVARGFHTSGAGSPQPSKFIMDYSGAMVKMNEDGTAMVLNAAADAGGGNISAYQSMVAEELGLDYQDVIVLPGDTDTTLFDVPTHASRGTYGAGLAVRKAAAKVRETILDWASNLLEVSAGDLVAEGGRILVRGSPARSVSIEEVVKAAQFNGWGSAAAEASLRPEACPPHFIACLVEVAVDVRTGQVQVPRAVSGADVGTPINLNNVEGQMVGGMHMGLGYALLEDTRFDPETGRVLNPDFHDYKMLTARDMPEVETILADTFEPSGPFGAKGVGEGVTNPVAAAVANAVYNAVGIRIKELPLTAEKILRALKEKEAASTGPGERGPRDEVV
ncbi:MAG: molybdopterin cofactor-binding domain-containing protein [Thermodesulfobacteriota bacterium]